MIGRKKKLRKDTLEYRFEKERERKRERKRD